MGNGSGDEGHLNYKGLTHTFETHLLEVLLPCKCSSNFSALEVEGQEKNIRNIVPYSTCHVVINKLQASDYIGQREVDLAR